MGVISWFSRMDIDMTITMKWQLFQGSPSKCAVEISVVSVCGRPVHNVMCLLYHYITAPLWNVSISCILQHGMYWAVWLEGWQKQIWRLIRHDSFWLYFEHISINHFTCIFNEKQYWYILPSLGLCRLHVWSFDGVNW